MIDEELRDEIACIEYQLNDGYLDIRDSCGDENMFDIVREAIILYKEKYNIK